VSGGGGGGGNDSHGNLRVEDETGPDGAPGAVRVITVNRAAVLNALDAETLRQLAAAFEDVAATPAIRCVVVTGAGEKAFAAGADIKSMAEIQPREARTLSELGLRVGELIESLPVPVVAAVNGYALGGGCELALACDFIHASTRARFGLPEVKLGLIPGFGGIGRLVRRVGIARARELVMTGETIDAAEALRIGLVNKVTEPEALAGSVRAVAAAVAAAAPLAVADAKRALGRVADRPLGDALALERELFAGLFGTADAREGMRAFVDKRPPGKWRGR
jgi:enoyl-CoA hydratase